MSEMHWESPLLSLCQPMCAYLLWLIARDLREWGAERRSKLTREEATALAMYLSDHLPPEARTEIEPVPTAPALRIAS
jgi:hypothetical protein